MSKINPLLNEMKEQTVKQRENIDEFSRNHMATATDIYRAEYYSEMVKKQIDRLNHYIQEFMKIAKKDGKELKRARENVMLAANILMCSHHALNDQLDALTVKTDLQIMINKNMIDQKERTNDLLEKAEKIITKQQMNRKT